MPGDLATASGALLRQLGDLCGHPLRITILNTSTGTYHERLSGVLAGVGPAGLTVDCVRLVRTPPPGTSVSVEVMDKGNLFWFYTSISPVAESRPGRLALLPPVQLETTQRRQFPRVDLDASAHLVLKATGTAYAVQFRDLSAGGASLRIEEPVGAGQRVLLAFELGSGLFFQDVEAETLRCTDTADGFYILAVRFCCGREQELAMSAWVNRRLAGDAD